MDAVLPVAVRVWLPGPLCPLAHASAWLDDRWKTGVWINAELVGFKDEELPCGCIPYEHEVYGSCQVQFAVRQIDAALEDTRLNEIGELWLRKIRETLTCTATR